eukprot:SAG11_NODE_879_length_6759_cov_5.103904_5_plen_137_part_00
MGEGLGEAISMHNAEVAPSAAVEGDCAPILEQGGDGLETVATVAEELAVALDAGHNRVPLPLAAMIAQLHLMLSGGGYSKAASAAATFQAVYGGRRAVAPVGNDEEGGMLTVDSLHECAQAFHPAHIKSGFVLAPP